jgi:hypothetical protein
VINLTSKKIFPPTPVPFGIDFVKPLSYDFRVVEVINDDGKIETVKLQVQIWEHDEFGQGTVKQMWVDVPRIKMDKYGTYL